MYSVGRTSPHRQRLLTTVLVCLSFAAAIGLRAATPMLTDTRVVRYDPAEDVAPRRTDPGATAPYNPQLHRLPDLVLSSVGRWAPADPHADLYAGAFSSTGLFVRLDLVLNGVVNPPGPLGCCSEPIFEPYRYGPNPVYGYVELDLDADPDTGGEIDIAHLTYLGNIGRYGGLPFASPLRERAARDASAFDSSLFTTPWVERSGEDFHLEIVGWLVDQANIQRSDNSNTLFGPGETWIVPGYFLHRAHAYSRFSSACCRAGAIIGSYEPYVALRFAHSIGANQTTISLVYPLTNAGSAAMRGEAEIEPPDIYYLNQNSVQEALQELQISAITATPAQQQDPAYALIQKWISKEPDAYLEPTDWRMTVLLGGAYSVPLNDGPYFVWSDLWPNVVLADFDGSGLVTANDVAMFDLFINNRDGAAQHDADGLRNGSVQIINPGPNFALFDLNGDGFVNAVDRNVLIAQMLPTIPDLDRDGDVDLVDFAIMQRCMGGGDGGIGTSGCAAADLNRDGVVDRIDVQRYLQCASGEGVPYSAACLSSP